MTRRASTSRQTAGGSTPAANQADKAPKTPSAETGKQATPRTLSREVLETAFLHVVDGIVVADEDGKIEAFNPAAEQLFGYPVAEVIGQNVTMLMPRDTARGHPQYIAKYLRGEPAGKVGKGPRELIAQRSNGEKFAADVAIGEAMVDSRRRFIAIIRDISDRKERERALRDALEAAEAAAERERKANRAKVSFLAALTHELRTPLNAILGFSELLERELSTAPNSKMGDYAQLIHDAGEQLLQLVNNLLEFARLEAPSLVNNPEPVHMRNFAAHPEKYWRPLVEKRALAFTVELDPAVPSYLVIEKRCLRHVLDNLLSNALKFTSDGEIVVRLRCSAGSQAHLILHGRVSDTGIGIAKEHAARIFEPFKQLEEGMSRRFEGAGLGLAICHRLCEIAGGNIGVDPNAPRGSVFWFELPAVELAPTS